jgi:hypothetical protein
MRLRKTSSRNHQAQGVPARRSRHPLALAALALAATACTPPAARLPPSPAAVATFGPESTGQIAVHTATDKPIVTTVVRHGDPLAAVAASVLTDGDGIASTALATLVEARLRDAGVTTAQSRADRDGYRVFALVASPEEAAVVVRRLHEALTSPVVASPATTGLVALRLSALRARPLDSPALLPVVQCTGELGALPTDPWFDPRTPDGLARLEQLRKLSHVRERISLAAVGTQAVTDAFVRQVIDGPAWTSGAPPGDPWPDQDRIGAYAEPATVDAPARLHLAIRMRDAFTATAVAERAAGQESPLLARVAATPGWQVARISATVRPRGACLGVVLDRKQDGSGAAIEVDAARAAALVVNELENSFTEVRADGSVAGRQVLRASDPREAASLAAWWSHTARLDPGPDRIAIALGLPPPKLIPSAPADTVDKLVTKSAQRFAASFRNAHAAWDRRVVEARMRVESGQGELWVLAASPCGILAESGADAGLTALAAVAASQPDAFADDVTLEPWVAQDGVGIVAHAAPRHGEGPHSLARRVADAAARALIHQRITEGQLGKARSAVLTLTDGSDAPFPVILGALARVLSPSHPSWFVPFGLRGSVVEASTAAVDLRWAAVSDGPVRMAVLANVDATQADTAIRALDRWIVRADGPLRACTSVAPATVPEAQHVTVDSLGEPPRAMLGVVVPVSDTASAAMLDLIAAALNGEDGWLARSLASFGARVRASARIAGGSHISALVIDIRGPDLSLDPAVSQVLAALDRLAKGAATADDLARGKAWLARQDREASLDPRNRLVAVWRNTAARPNVSLADWNTWLARTLNARNISSVRSTAQRAQPGPTE